MSDTSHRKIRTGFPTRSFRSASGSKGDSGFESFLSIRIGRLITLASERSNTMQNWNPEELYFAPHRIFVVIRTAKALRFPSMILANCTLLSPRFSRGSIQLSSDLDD